jgi:hypothetical protein
MSRSPLNPVTAEELAAALAGVLAAPKDEGQVRLLCSRPKPNARTYPDRFVVSRSHGVAGDFEMSRPWLTLPDGSPDPRNQVSIIGWRVLDLVWRERNPLAHPGDNIAVDMNLTEENLPVGTLLAVGSAVLRVSDEPNDGCVKWKVRFGRAALNWVAAPDHTPLRLRGIFCSVEQDGEVKLGDTMRRL